MKHRQLILWALFSALPFCAVAQNKSTDARIEYIKTFKDLAIKEMKRSGVPASITLAQGILESNAGQSTLAVQANNHFGIKCHNSWKGKTFYRVDDDRDGDGNLIKSCFRKYRKVEHSFKDHSDFLTDPKKHYRYGHLFNLEPDDYKSWCYGLQSSGYATAKGYGEHLIRIVEEYKLYIYDQTEEDMPSDGGGDIVTSTGSRRSFGHVNDVKVVVADKGETIEDVARRYGINPRKVICFNDCRYDRTQKLDEKTRIYIQQKQKKNRGRQREHAVREGETMFGIAQKYGIRLADLYKMNNMRGGTQPAYGEDIWLKTGWFRKRKDSPRTRDLNAPAPETKPSDTKPSVPTSNQPGVPPTRPNTTQNQPQDGAVLPPGSSYEPDGDELFEEPQKDTTAPTTDKPATTGVERPDDPKPPTANTPSTGAGSSGANTPQQPTGSVAYHSVVKGDTLYSISRRYEVSVEQLRQMNNLSGNIISIGQQLRVK